MIGFEPFDIRCWAEKGLTVALPVRKSSKGRVEKNTSLKTCFFGVVTAAIVSVATPALGKEPSQSALNWFTPITATNGISDPDTVPKEYWPRLISVLREAPLLPDDDYSINPAPII